MPSFVDIATLTKLLSLTGNEEFQVSPTQKVTATQIANKVQLAQVLMGGFEAISINGVEKIKDTNSLIGAMKILYSLSGNGRAKVIGNSENCFGLVSINTAGTLAFGILFDIRDTTPPSIFIRDGFGLTGGASLKNLTDDQWIAELKKGKKIPMESGSGVADPIQIHDFAEVSAIDNWPTPKDGLIIPFVTDSGVLNKPGNESEYVGIIICEVDTQNTGRAEVIAYGSGTGACYVGLLDYASASIEWMVNKMSVAGKKLSAFTGIAIGNYIQSMGNDGDLFPFVTVNANKTTANQFPANGAWSGFVTIGDGGGVNIIAFKSTTDPNAEVYVGRCSGGTTQWTLVGGGSGGGVTAPVQISEYGAFYDYTELNNVPAGSVTAWYAPGSNVDGDLGPFKGLSEHTEGIYIAIKGSEDSTYREGIMVAYRADDTDKGIAYAHVQGSPGNGGIKYATDWMTINSGASSGGIAVGATLWAGEVSLNDDAPDVFDLPSGLQNGDILTIMYDLYVGTTPDNFFVTGVNMGRTFNVVVGEHLTSVQFSAFYNAGGSQGGVISDNGTMDIDCTVSQLTVIVRGGESYPVGSRITVKRIYKSADNNPAYN